MLVLLRRGRCCKTQPGARHLAGLPNSRRRSGHGLFAQGASTQGGIRRGFALLNVHGPGPGQTVASYVGNGGLTVNWAVAPGAAPVASAKAGTATVASAGNPVSNISFMNSLARRDGGMCFVKSGRKFCDNGYACTVFPYGYYYCSCCRTHTVE